MSEQEPWVQRWLRTADAALSRGHSFVDALEIADATLRSYLARTARPGLARCPHDEGLPLTPAVQSGT